MLKERWFVEAIMVCFKILLQHFPTRTEKNYENFSQDKRSPASTFNTQKLVVYLKFNLLNSFSWDSNGIVVALLKLLKEEKHMISASGDEVLPLNRSQTIQN
jgi:hypothetical protein